MGEKALHSPSATSGGGSRKLAGTGKVAKPNATLEAVRHAIPSKLKPGEPMSRREVVDLANGYIQERAGTNSPFLMTVHYLGSLERGASDAPRDLIRRDALHFALNVSTDAELGWPERRSPLTVPPRRRTTKSRHRAVPVDDDEAVDAEMDDTTRDVERVASRVHARTVSETALRRYRSDLATVSTQFVHEPVTTWLPKLNVLWKDLSVHLDNGPRQSQARELYLLGGMACVVLAHASHLRGRAREGLVHVEAALLWAQEAGHDGLLAWTLGTQALLTETNRGPIEALRILEQAQSVLAGSQRPGTGEVRLACYEARFSAQAGQRDRALAAVRASEDASGRLGGGVLSDLDYNGGILTFGEPKRASFCAGPYLSFGHPGRAEDYARAAVVGYLNGPDDQYSYGDVALAQVTMAQARLEGGQLDGVLDAMQPVLALPQQKRITPVKTALALLAATLDTPRYRGSLEATRIRASVTAFTNPRTKRRAIMSG